MPVVQGAKCLRHLLRGEDLLIAPGVFNGLSARVAEQAGASVLYASGGAIVRAVDYPDLGLLTMSEMCDHIASASCWIPASSRKGLAGDR